MPKGACVGGPNAGVYVVQGPLGFEVGQSSDSVVRNEEYTKLGIPWRLLRRMPGSSLRERVRAETEIANFLCSQGFVVVTLNTTEARKNQGRKSGLGNLWRGKKCPPRTPEHQNKLNASRWGDRCLKHEGSIPKESTSGT